MNTHGLRDKMMYIDGLQVKTMYANGSGARGRTLKAHELNDIRPQMMSQNNVRIFGNFVGRFSMSSYTCKKNWPRIMVSVGKS